MTELTYNSLFSALQNYVKRPADVDFEAILPIVINNAERRLAVELKLLYNKQVVTGTMTAGNYVITKPQDWRETISFQMGTGSPPYESRMTLYPRQYGMLELYWPDRTATAAPSSTNQFYYADYDRANFYIAPTPAANYPYELTYYANPSFLSPTNQTNFYTLYMPDILLKACLVETPGYLKRPEFAQILVQDYRELLAAYNNEDKGRVMDQANIRTEGQ